MTFHDLLDKLSALPRTQRFALYGLLYVGLGAIFWFLLYSPAREDVVFLQDEQITLTAERDRVKARAENREKFEEDLRQLTNDLKQAMRELPNDREIPELLKRISNVGRKAGLEIRKFQPMPEVKRQYYAEVPVSLEVYGSYHEVAMFFDRLSKLGRIVYVQDVEMTSPEDRGGKVYMMVTGTAVTFRFLTEDEISAASQQSERRGKGKRGAKAEGGEE